MKEQSMPEKDPLTYAILTYAWILGLSFWGGISGYIRKIKHGHRDFSITELVGEICISGFVGIVTFFICESAEIPPVLTAAIIGISSHMGSRAILMLEQILQRMADKWLKKND